MPRSMSKKGHPELIYMSIVITPSSNISKDCASFYVVPISSSITI
jgi:hypothetical protein